MTARIDPGECLTKVPTSSPQPASRICLEAIAGPCDQIQALRIDSSGEAIAGPSALHGCLHYMGALLPSVPYEQDNVLIHHHGN